MNEIWREIKEFPEYEISGGWRVRKKADGKLVKTSTNDNGCTFVVLRKEGKGYSRSIYKLANPKN